MALLFPLTAFAMVTGSPDARAAYDFHGLLFTCGPHPVVQVSGRLAFAYEADLTHYTTGTAVLGRNAVSVAFPGRYGRFTITKRADRFLADGKVCAVDDV